MRLGPIRDIIAAHRTYDAPQNRQLPAAEPRIRNVLDGSTSPLPHRRDRTDPWRGMHPKTPPGPRRNLHMSVETIWPVTYTCGHTEN